MVDLVGLLISVSPTSTIQKQDGVETVKHTIGLRDMSGYSIDIILWGEHCQIEGAKLATLCGLPTPLAVAIKGGCVTKFNGKTIGTISNTTVFINPYIEQTSILQNWFHENGFRSTSPSLTRNFNASHSGSRKLITINDLQTLQSSEKRCLVLFCSNHHKC